MVIFDSGLDATPGEDFASFVAAQEGAAAAYRDTERWTTMSILNTATSGRFSTDRTMRDYNRDIWALEPVRPDPFRGGAADKP